MQAVSITDEPPLTEYAEILYPGGAPYVNIMAPALKTYTEKLEKSRVGHVRLFTTSNWLRRTVLALKKLLREKGIQAENESFYAHMPHMKGRADAAEVFGKRHKNFYENRYIVFRFYYCRASASA